MDRLSQILLACQDVLRWQLVSNRLCNKTSNILRMGCCYANTRWSPGSEISISTIRGSWSSTPGRTPCLKIFPGTFTAASKLFNLHTSGLSLSGQEILDGNFYEFLSFFHRTKYTQASELLTWPLENIKGSRRISLRTKARNCVKHFCLGSSLSRGFGPFSGLAVPCKDFDRILGYPLAAFSFAMPFLAG